jgi:hypothetical protein
MPLLGASCIKPSMRYTTVSSRKFIYSEAQIHDAVFFLLGVNHNKCCSDCFTTTRHVDKSKSGIFLGESKPSIKLQKLSKIVVICRYKQIMEKKAFTVNITDLI